jgi:acyl carrier protein
MDRRTLSTGILATMLVAPGHASHAAEGNPSECMSKLKKLIVEHLGVEPTKVMPGARFVDDLGADSLDTIELVLAIEEEFAVGIPDEQAKKMVTVQDVFNFLRKSRVC